MPQARDPDGTVRPLLRRDTAKEGQIGRRDLRLRRQPPVRHPLQHRGNKPSLWQREVLRIETTGVSRKALNTGCSSGKSSRPCSVVTNGTFCWVNIENGR
jgi:hypothetical protein